MVRVFALAPETLRRILRRTLLRFQALVTVSFLAFALYLTFLSTPVRWQLAGPIVGIVALAYFLVIFFNYRQQLRLLYSIRYEMDHSAIIYRQANQAPLRLMRADVTGAVERKDGLWIETVDGAGLLILNGLARNGDQEMRSVVENWVEIRRAVPQQGAPFGRMVLIGLAGMLVVLLFANRLEIILPLGVLALVTGLYTERRLTRIQDAVPGRMRMYNMAFSFLIFVLIMKSCLIGMAMLMVTR